MKDKSNLILPAYSKKKKQKKKIFVLVEAKQY